MLQRIKELIRKYPTKSPAINLYIITPEGKVHDTGHGICSKNVYNGLRKKATAPKGSDLILECPNTSGKGIEFISQSLNTALPGWEKFWGVSSKYQEFVPTEPNEANTEPSLFFRFKDLEQLNMEQFYLLLTMVRTVGYTPAAFSIYELLLAEYGGNINNTFLFYLSVAFNRQTWYGFETILQPSVGNFGLNRIKNFYPLSISKTLNYCYKKRGGTRGMVKFKEDVSFYDYSTDVMKGKLNQGELFPETIVDNLDEMKECEKVFLGSLNKNMKGFILKLEGMI